MKRILVNGLPIRMGGIGSLLVNLVTYNKQIGNSNEWGFEFLVHYQSAYQTWLKQEGYPHYRIPPLKRLFRYLTLLWRLFRKRHYDYVWINNTSKVDILLPWIAKNIGKAKIIQHAHGTDNEAKGIRRLVFGLCEFLWGKAYEKLIDIPLACSGLSADYFYKNPCLREKCVVLHNGIYVEQFKFNEKARFDTRKALGITADGSVLLGAVGRLSKVKNYSFLIDLMHLLPQSHYCIIVGDGEDKDLLAAQIEALQLQDRVKLLGKRNDIPDLLCAMDIFVMPSLNEGLPFSLIEAQAAGLTCLVSTGVPEEADLSGNVNFIPLSIPLYRDALCDFTPRNDRHTGYTAVNNAGYSIESTYGHFINCLNIP